MQVLTNKGKRRLGVPGRPAIILDANQGVPITESQLELIQKNRTVCRWLESGILVITEDGEVAPVVVKTKSVSKKRDRISTAPRETLVLPKGVIGEGIELHHVGGGWWEVYVNGFKATDKNVRKDEAESMATEYEE